MPDIENSREVLKNRYIGGESQKIEGWFYPQAVQALVLIDKFQRAAGIEGHIGEIGLYHGKSFILLYLLARDSEKCVGIDVFLDEEFKTSFFANMGRYEVPGSPPRIEKMDSVDLTSRQLIDWVNGFYRLFSIDGGHQMEMALGDLERVAPVLAEGGVIAYDDYFDPQFPGVSEALNRFLLGPAGVGIAPFFIAGGKVFLTTAGAHELLYKAFETVFEVPLEESKKDHEGIYRRDFHGWPVFVLI